MNKIQKYVYGVVSIANKVGVKLNFNAEELINELTEASYKNNAIENLVNITDLSSNSLNIGDILNEGCYEEDFEILTYTRVNSEGEEFDTKEEYDEYLENKANEEYENYSIKVNTEFAIIDSNNNDKYIDGEFDSIEEANDKLDYYKETSKGASGYKVTPYSQAEILDSNEETIEELDEFVDRNTMLQMAKERLEELKEELVEEFIDNEECWDDLDYEYNEVYYNVVRNFNDDANIESAKKAGLGVISLPKLNEDFLFLRGCGMDMSFCFVKYLAYQYGALSNEYLDKLEWTKLNSSEVEFKEILTYLGVDIEKLSESFFNRR